MLLINYDVGLLALGADLVNSGGLLYRDIHTEMFPGAYLILASCFKVFGTSQFVSQVATACVIIAVGGLILILSRRFIDGWLALLPASITIVMGAYTSPYFSHHWCSLFFVLLYAICLVRLVSLGTKTPAAIFGAGVVGGLAVLCYQVQVVPVLAGLLAAASLLRSKGEAFRFSGWLLFGLTTVAFGLLGFLVFTGTLNHFFESTLKFVFFQYGSVNQVAYGFSNFQAITVSAFNFPWRIASATPFGILKCAPIIVAVAICFSIFKQRSFSNCLKSAPVVLLIAVAFGLLIGESHKPDMRLLIWAQPVMLIAVFYFADRVQYQYRSARILVPLCAMLVSIGLVLDAKVFLYSFPETATEYSTNRGVVRSVSNLKILEILCKRLKPGEKLLVYPYDTGVMFLSGGRFPSRYPVLHYGYHTESQFREVIEDMEKSGVRYVVWNRLFDNPNFSELGFPSYKQVSQDKLIMEPYLKDHFEPAGQCGEYLLLKRK
ncbi:MAG: hypothetical protein K8F91_24375 [Candidatus Obscuribacterales bacterium]|nr:hypothetical protein [Candidatus Obscuribacterales bacterium]